MIWLDNSRIIAMYAVVFVHVAYGVVLGNQIGSEEWWIGNVYESATRWCVPVFVMISGALLLDPKKQEALLDFYKKRTSRILYPLIAWTVIYLFWVYLLKGLHTDRSIAAQLAERVVIGKPYYHLWFLYMLIGLYLFTPFFRIVVAHASRAKLIAFVVIAFIFSAINAIGAGETTLFTNLFLPYIPYFFLGYLIRTSTIDFNKFSLIATSLVCLVVTIFGCYFLSKTNGLAVGMYFYKYLGVTVIPMSISIMLLLKKLERPVFNRYFNNVSALTLGIYLIHPMVLDILGHLGLHPGVDYPLHPVLLGMLRALNLQPVSISPLISVPIIAIITFIISLFGALLTSRIPYLKRII